MARIRLDHIRHAYSPALAAADIYALLTRPIVELLQVGRRTLENADIRFHML